MDALQKPCAFIEQGTFVLVFQFIIRYCSMRKFCTASLLVFLLGACGLKAPLYLPQEQPPKKSQQPQQSQDPERRK
jgi:predicted small lipoprotein YifL